MICGRNNLKNYVPAKPRELRLYFGFFFLLFSIYFLLVLTYHEFSQYEFSSLFDVYFRRY